MYVTDIKKIENIIPDHQQIHTLLSNTGNISDIDNIQRNKTNFRNISTSNFFEAIITLTPKQRKDTPKRKTPDQHNTKMLHEVLAHRI